jgi:hypothetical protein
MSRVARTLSSVLLLSAAVSAAGSVDGPWIGRSASDQSDVPALQLALTTDGSTLTGTATTGGSRYTIENGTAVDGNLVFDAVQPVDGGTSRLALSCTGTATIGTANDDAIDLKCQIAGAGEKTFALKRLIGG